MTLIKNMTRQELISMEKRARRGLLSPFAKFNTNLKGYDLYYKNKKIDKWDAWACGYRDSDSILNGHSRVRCEIREVIKKTTE